MKRTEKTTPAPTSDDYRQFSQRFFDYFYRDRKELPEECLVVKCPPDMQQFWINRVIESLNSVPLEYYTLEDGKNRYRIKNLLGVSGTDFEKLFPSGFGEAPEPPPPPLEELKR